MEEYPECSKCKNRELKRGEFVVKTRDGKKLRIPEKYITIYCDNPSCRFGFKERKRSERSYNVQA